jgi:NAD(P)-dependent dehydrogenase (short-subunit alcohol dehydrogenase family)
MKMNNDTKSHYQGKEKVDQQVAVVTCSGSRGIGYETSLSLARNGFYIFATVRRLGESINPVPDIAMKGFHPGYRGVHVQGRYYAATFRATPEAKKLS